MGNVEYDSLLNMGMGLLFGLDERERELWKMCDIRLGSELNGIQNAAYLAASGKPEWRKRLFEKYDSLFQRYGQIDVAKLDERYSPEVIKEVRRKLAELGGALEDYEKMSEIMDGIKPLIEKFRTPRYKMYRETVNELERK